MKCLLASGLMLALIVFSTDAGGARGLRTAAGNSKQEAESQSETWMIIQQLGLDKQLTALEARLSEETIDVSPTEARKLLEGKARVVRMAMVELQRKRAANRLRSKGVVAEWEYKVFRIANMDTDELVAVPGDLEAALNDLGKSGWELCATTQQSVLILKRRLDKK